MFRLALCLTWAKQGAWARGARWGLNRGSEPEKQGGGLNRGPEPEEQGGGPKQRAWAGSELLIRNTKAGSEPYQSAWVRDSADLGRFAWTDVDDAGGGNGEVLRAYLVALRPECAGRGGAGKPVKRADLYLCCAVSEWVSEWVSVCVCVCFFVFVRLLRCDRGPSLRETRGSQEQQMLSGKSNDLIFSRCVCVGGEGRGGRSVCVCVCARARFVCNETLSSSKRKMGK